MARILIVDDESLTRAALRDYLSLDPSLEVIWEVASGASAVQLATQCRPDVILMDMQMPIMDGVAATVAIRATDRSVKILGLSSFATDRYVVDLIRAGASGYLVKDTPPREIIAAIHEVLRDESVLSPEVTRHVVQGLEQSVPAEVTADPELLLLLTDKELEVIRLLARGMSNREMAQELFVTESTIKARFVKVMEQLGVRDRVQILVTTVARGLVDLRTTQERTGGPFRTPPFDRDGPFGVPSRS
ncbi:response regulator transcription factor [Micrococcales bacterium 31B]|nr:response regulator transcription factor [Micrococcales bacterium 31B]